jgi:hypothetical protein
MLAEQYAALAGEAEKRAEHALAAELYRAAILVLYNIDLPGSALKAACGVQERYAATKMAR